MSHISTRTTRRLAFWTTASAWAAAVATAGFGVAMWLGPQPQRPLIDDCLARMYDLVAAGADAAHRGGANPCELVDSYEQSFNVFQVAGVLGIVLALVAGGTWQLMKHSGEHGHDFAARVFGVFGVSVFAWAVSYLVDADAYSRTAFIFLLPVAALLGVASVCARESARLLRQEMERKAAVESALLSQEMARTLAAVAPRRSSVDLRFRASRSR